MEIKMKHEEAYDLIESCLEYDKDMSDYPERYEMALQIAREVFHKQKPKKYYNDPDDGKCCPTCLERATFQTFKLGFAITVKMKFCQNCGQAIDWREE